MPSLLVERRFNKAIFKIVRVLDLWNQIFRLLSHKRKYFSITSNLSQDLLKTKKDNPVNKSIFFNEKKLINISNS